MMTKNYHGTMCKSSTINIPHPIRVSIELNINDVEYCTVWGELGEEKREGEERETKLST